MKRLIHPKRLSRDYKALYADMVNILYQHDPIGFGPDAPPDEYEPEAGRILTRFDQAASPAALGRLIHSVFVECFDARTAGPVSRYTEIALDAWKARQGYGIKW